MLLNVHTWMSPSLGAGARPLADEGVTSRYRTLVVKPQMLWTSPLAVTTRPSNRQR